MSSMQALAGAHRAESGASATESQRSGPASITTLCDIPAYTNRFINRLSRKERPLRPAVAPTASPNAIMPGSTGSASRAPRLKPEREQRSARADSPWSLLIGPSWARGSIAPDGRHKTAFDTQALQTRPQTSSNARGSSGARSLRHAVQDHVLLAEFESRIGPGLDIVSQRLRPLLPIVAIHATVGLDRKSTRLTS